MTEGKHIPNTIKAIKSIEFRSVGHAATWETLKYAILL
jgi:hypothetical protein